MLETGLRTATYKLATLMAVACHIASPDVARDRLPTAYSRAVDDVALTLVQQPLRRLQRVTGADAGPTFLYDDSWLHDHVSWRTIKENGGVITPVSRRCRRTRPANGGVP